MASAATATLLAAASGHAQVAVESTRAGFAADRAGIRAGDVLASWERAARPPFNPEPASGEIRSPMTLRLVELEQAPRGPVRLHGTRGGRDFAVELPAAEWRVQARPLLDAGALAEYEHGKALFDTDAAAATAVWERLAGSLEAGDPLAAGGATAEAPGPMAHRSRAVWSPVG